MKTTALLAICCGVIFTVLGYLVTKQFHTPSNWNEFGFPITVFSGGGVTGQYTWNLFGVLQNVVFWFVVSFFVIFVFRKK